MRPLLIGLCQVDRLELRLSVIYGVVYLPETRDLNKHSLTLLKKSRAVIIPIGGLKTWGACTHNFDVGVQEGHFLLLCAGPARMDNEGLSIGLAHRDEAIGRDGDLEPGEGPGV